MRVYGFGFALRQLRCGKRPIPVTPALYRQGVRSGDLSPSGLGPEGGFFCSAQGDASDGIPPGNKGCEVVYPKPCLVSRRIRCSCEPPFLRRHPQPTSTSRPSSRTSLPLNCPFAKTRMCRKTTETTMPTLRSSCVNFSREISASNGSL